MEKRLAASSFAISLLGFRVWECVTADVKAGPRSRFRIQRPGFQGLGLGLRASGLGFRALGVWVLGDSTRLHKWFFKGGMQVF